ncbi:MAG TPA: hypothetical protein VGM84_10595 [Steroidobacteraceae bacterium]|jgi:hypothetical protein
MMKARSRAVLLALMVGLAGCDQLGSRTLEDSKEVPSSQELNRIAYMASATTAPSGRKVYTRFEDAKSCGDYETALRWNRPPDVAAGPFHKKMVYLTQSIPADLPDSAEVFLVGKVEKGGTLPSGAGGWLLKMADGSTVQAIESVDFWVKEDQGSEHSTGHPVVKPYVPGRKFCAQGVYQGVKGKDGTQSVPLFSLMFAMDRDK